MYRLQPQKIEGLSPLIIEEATNNEAKITISDIESNVTNINLQISNEDETETKDLSYEIEEGQEELIVTEELFDGYNKIISLDDIQYNLDVEYTPKLTREIINQFLTGVTYAYLQLNTGEIINYDNYLKSIELDDCKYIPDQGIFGGAIAKEVKLEFNNSINIVIQDKEFDLYIGVLYNEKYYYIKYGTYIVQHPDTETTTDNTTFTALDYMTKFNEPYIDSVEYPCTIRQLAENICKNTGVKLQKESFRNEDFIIENNQFVNGESKRQIIQGIALSAFSWARVDEDNILHFDLNNKENYDIEIDYDNYFNLSKDDLEYGPINRIILRNSQIEGENVTIDDPNNPVTDDNLCELVIADNPFAYTQEKREQMIQAGTDLFGFKYMPINSMNLIGYIFLNCLDRIRLKDLNNETFDTYIFDHNITYNGTSLDYVETKAMTKTETKYTYIPTTMRVIKNTQVIVDKAEQTINSIANRQDEQRTKISTSTTKFRRIRN